VAEPVFAACASQCRSSIRQIAHGATVDEILKGYPDLEPDDIQQAIEYAAWLTQEQAYPA
jgi:uncharacterized protein (DUF433 family)